MKQYLVFNPMSLAEKRGKETSQVVIKIWACLFLWWMNSEDEKEELKAERNPWGYSDAADAVWGLPGLGLYLPGSKEHPSRSHSFSNSKIWKWNHFPPMLGQGHRSAGDLLPQAATSGWTGLKRCTCEAVGLQHLPLHVWRSYVLLTSASMVLLKSRIALKIIIRLYIDTATVSLYLQGSGILHVQINSAPVFSVFLLCGFLRLVAWWNRMRKAVS